MANRKDIFAVGYASGLGGADASSEQGPLILRNSHFLKALNLHWTKIISNQGGQAEKKEIIHTLNKQLSKSIETLVKNKQFFMVSGGDHSSAIGTWSGARSALPHDAALGLIWIDAHMDSHTPETTHSGNIHGMPLASLLGYGDRRFTHLTDHHPVLKPENICLIGIRSYEAEEKIFLDSLGVKIYYIDEVHEKSMEVVLAEAIQHVTQHTHYYGVTLDIDALDPNDAPGTGTIEKNGIKADALCAAFKLLAEDTKLIGLEIAEFDPSKDKNHQTEMLIANIISAGTGGSSP